MSTEPLAVDNVARHLGDAGWRRMTGRDIRPKTLGRSWPFKLSQVDEWIEAGPPVEFKGVAEQG